MTHGFNHFTGDDTIKFTAVFLPSSEGTVVDYLEVDEMA